MSKELDILGKLRDLRNNAECEGMGFSVKEKRKRVEELKEGGWKVLEGSNDFLLFGKEDERVRINEFSELSWNINEEWAKNFEERMKKRNEPTRT